MRRRVDDAAAELDDRYLDLHDDEKSGGRTAGWEEAFRLARAAASLGFALDPDATIAALNATYEALHALDGDVDRVRALVAAA